MSETQPACACFSFFRRTSKMSHDSGRRAACLTANLILEFHFEFPSVARGVTDTGVGSGALFGSFHQIGKLHLPAAFLHRFEHKIDLCALLDEQALGLPRCRGH